MTGRLSVSLRNANLGERGRSRPKLPRHAKAKVATSYDGIVSGREDALKNRCDLIGEAHCFPCPV